MDTLDLYQRLALALAIGLLVGVERGWREREEGEGTRTAGIRTFGLIGLLGGIWAAMMPALGPVPLATAGLAFAAAFILFQWREAVARDSYSVTSTIAGLVVFALGAFAVLGNQAAAAGAGVATLVILAARTNLHDFLRRLSWPELRSIIVLLGMTFLLLPILPDRTLDPWGAINLHDLWLMVVLIAAISFAGYVAVRLFGQRCGLLVSAAAGAVVSSTTVTLLNSRLAAKSKETGTLATAICIAWIVSLVRMTLIACVINPTLITALAAPITAAVSVLAIAAVLFRYASAKEHPGADGSMFENPLDISFVLGFGALLAAVSIAAKLMSTFFGEAGVLGLAGISGFVDVDPITLSTARLAGTSLTIGAAAEAILLAAAANMLTKTFVAVSVGGFRFGWKLVLAGLLALVSGAAVFIGLGVP
jgi:uncharacterized membrane protein (DUF4010 family)